MKRIILIIVLAAGFVACKQSVKGTNGVTYKTPVQYNDYIVSRQSSLMKNIIKFADVAQVSLDSAELLLNGFVTQANDMTKELEGMPPYKGDSALRDAAINSFKFYKKAFDEYYRDIIRLRKEDAEDATENINEIVTIMTTDEEKHDKIFHNAQRDFSEKNNMKLKENDMQKKIDEMKENDN